MRGGGKSATGERIGEIYYNRGYLILDWWSSIDLENAFWCIPGILDKDRGYDPQTGKKKDEHARDVGYPVLIIRPKTTTIDPVDSLCICGVPLSKHNAETKCEKPQALIKTITDDTPLKDILELAYHEKRICILSPGFYENHVDALRTLGKFLRELPILVIQNVLPSHISMLLFMREMGNIVPQGLQNYGSGVEALIKRPMQQLVREARHLRITLVGDFQRSADIAKQIVSQRDFFFFKKITRDLIPDDYKWLWDRVLERKYQAKRSMDYKTFRNLTPLSQLQPWESIVVFPDNYFVKINLRQAGFKHKKPDDTWAELANCTVKYLDKNEVKTTKSQKALEREAKERVKVEKLNLIHVYRLQNKPWDWIVKQVKWPGYEKMRNAKEIKKVVNSAQVAHKRASEIGLFSPVQAENANAVVDETLPVDDNNEEGSTEDLDSQ